jgi:hypothetical protein
LATCAALPTVNFSNMLSAVLGAARLVSKMMARQIALLMALLFLVYFQLRTRVHRTYATAIVTNSSQSCIVSSDTTLPPLLGPGESSASVQGNLFPVNYLYTSKPTPSQLPLFCNRFTSPSHPCYARNTPRSHPSKWQSLILQYLPTLFDVTFSIYASSIISTRSVKVLRIPRHAERFVVQDGRFGARKALERRVLVMARALCYVEAALLLVPNPETSLLSCRARSSKWACA